MTLHLPHDRVLHCTFRRWLFYRVFIGTGHKESDIVPYWLYPLWFLANPARFVWRWFGCTHLVPNRDEYMIDGLRFSGKFFYSLKCRPLPGPWTRIVQREDGLITWEEQTTRRDHDE